MSKLTFLLSIAHWNLDTNNFKKISDMTLRNILRPKRMTRHYHIPTSKPDIYDGLISGYFVTFHYEELNPGLSFNIMLPAF